MAAVAIVVNTLTTEPFIRLFTQFGASKVCCMHAALAAHQRWCAIRGCLTANHALLVPFCFCTESGLQLLGLFGKRCARVVPQCGRLPLARVDQIMPILLELSEALGVLPQLDTNLLRLRTGRTKTRSCSAFQVSSLIVLSVTCCKNRTTTCIQGGEQGCIHHLNLPLLP